MSTLTIELSDEQKARLEAASAAQLLAPAQWARQAVIKALPAESSPGTQPNALDALQDMVGCFDSGVTDLATNPKHLEGLGQWRS